MELTKVQIGLLNGKENWATWKFKMGILLRSQSGVMDLVEGKLQEPTRKEDSSTDETAKYESDLEKFKKADCTAMILITTNLSDVTLEKVMRFTNARDVWLELHRLFDGVSEDKAYEICQEFFSFNRDPSIDISGNLSKLKNLWNSLKLEISKEGGNKFVLPDLFLICKILGMLPEDYFAFKSSWMMMAKSERTIENLTTQLCAYEKALGRNFPSQEALWVKSEIKTKNKASSETKGTNKKVTCHYCQKIGHKVKQCTKWKADGRPPKPPTSKVSEDSKPSSNMTLSVDVMMTETNSDCWYVDNGATNHVTFREDLFQKFQPFFNKESVMAANGESINALGKGTIDLDVEVNGKNKRVTLENVWYVPGIKRNLFSVLASQDLHLQSQFKSTTETCQLEVNGEVALMGYRCRQGGLYKLKVQNVKPSKPIEVNLLTNNENLLQVYHERMGHQNTKHVKATIERELGIKLTGDKELCEGCVYGKSHRLKFGTRERATTPGERIHTDVCGPFQSSMSGYKYYVLFKDDYSRYRHVHFMKEKSEVSGKLKLFLAAAKTTGHVVKEIVSDNGGEFDNGVVKRMLQNRGIKHIMTMPYTPQQNGCSERENRTIVESARAMMHCHESLPQGLWAELINCAAYILNRTGPSSEADKTPYELWLGKRPSIKHLRIIGSVCYPHVPKQKRKKMRKKAQKGILVGYDECGYRIWVKETNTLVRSRDVIFNEEPLLQRKEYQIPFSNETSQENDCRGLEDDVEDNVYQEPEESEDKEEETDLPEGSNTYGLRNRSEINVPKRFDDYILTAVTNVQDLNEPESYTEAMRSGKASYWKEAMESEMKSHKENQTWTLEKLPAGKKCLTCKWLYNVKTNPDGSVDRFKARLVVRGFSQKKGVDFNQTFSPVARLSTIRSLLSVAAVEHLSLTQFDVSTAFLYGQVDEVIYMTQPEGYKDGTDRVCRLNKSLYGLKQAPRCWSTRFNKFMELQGFKKSDADPCLFIKEDGKSKLIVALYVDDGLIATNNTGMLQKFMDHLTTEFKITSKPASFYLGLEIEQKSCGNVRISQKAYTKKILDRFQMSDCKPAPIPIVKESETQLAGKAESSRDKFSYREAVGALMYLMTATRPDIAYAVSKASRTLENPTHEDFVRVKRILRYLKGTIDYGIEYQSKENNHVLECFSDADHAGDSSTGHSTTGVVCNFGGGVITWLSQKQSSVAISSTEAEIVAASEACREIVWLKRLLEEITTLKSVPVLKIDNEATTRLAENPENHRRTKHIKIRHFFIRELVAEGQVKVNHVPAEFQLADCMTKPLHKPRLKTLWQAMGLNQ